MARLCSQCKYYTDSGETECPRCHVALQFTLLPPPGQPAASSPQVSPEPQPTPMGRRRRETASTQFGDMIRWIRGNRLVFSSVMSVILIAGGLIFGWGRQSLEARYDRIKVGMSEQEVRNILSPPSRGRKWRTPDWYNEPVLNTEGYASYTHQEDTGSITLEFMDGRVMRKSMSAARSAGR